MSIRVLRLFLAVVVMLAMVAVSAVAEGAGESKEWTASTAVPPADPIALFTDYFAELVEEKTDGQITINTIHGAALGGDRDQMEAVLEGAIEICNPGQSMVGIWYPPAEIWTLPYLFTSVEHKNRVWDEIRDEYSDEVAANSGIRPLASVPRPPRLLTSNAPVESPADLEGMKIRVPETPMWLGTFQRFGASPVSMALPEVYTALQTGVIDGQENPIDLNYNFGFLEVNKYLTLTEHMMQDNVLMMSEEKYQQLSDDVKSALREAAIETEQHFRKYWEEQTEEYMAKTEELGVTIIEPDKEEWMALVRNFENEFPNILPLYNRIREID